MGLNEDLRNCRIVIRDAETGRTVADTTILTCDDRNERIEIASGKGALKEGTRISALIFSSAGLYESHGTVGEAREERTAVVLDEGTGKNDRQAVRYRVNIQGNIDYINRPSEGKLRDNFDICILNMSSIGLLVQAPAGRIKEGDVIRFSATSKGQRLSITAEATRVAGAEKDQENIGCKIQLVNLG